MKVGYLGFVQGPKGSGYSYYMLALYCLKLPEKNPRNFDCNKTSGMVISNI